jgi:hypothetical protein
MTLGPWVILIAFPLFLSAWFENRHIHAALASFGKEDTLKREYSQIKNTPVGAFLAS